MSSINSQYDASAGTVPSTSYGSGSGSNSAQAITNLAGAIPTVVDYTAFASSGTTLAIANKPDLDFYKQPNNPFKTLDGVPPNSGANIDYVQVGAMDSRSYVSAPTFSCTQAIQTSSANNIQNFSGTPLFSTVARTGNYADLTAKPVLSTVATSGAYTDLTAKPVLSTVANTGSYADLAGKPVLSTVATSGAYTDLTGKPTIPATVDYGAASSSGTTLAIANKPTIPTTVDYGAASSSGTTLAIANKPTIPATVDYAAASSSGTTLAIANKPALKTVATTGVYADLTGKPVLATVATSGLYSDLTSTPTIPTTVDYGAASSSGTTLAIANKPTIPTTVDYNAATSSGTTLAVVNKPTIPTTVDYTVASSSGTTLAVANKPSIPNPVTMVSNSFIAYGNANVYSPTTFTFPATGGYQFYNTQSQVAFIQMWYYCPSPVTFIAGEASIVNGNNGSSIWTWDYIDPSKGFVQNNMNIVYNRPPGFWSAIGNTPTYAGLNAGVTNNTGTANTYSLNAISLPAGRHEFRLASYSFNTINNSSAGTPVFSLANFTNTVPYLSLTDYSNSGALVQMGSITVPNNVIVGKRLLIGSDFLYQNPGYWKYNLTTSFTLPAATNVTPTQTNWTLTNPTGSATIMNSNGSLTIRQTGIYTVSINVYVGTNALVQIYVNTSDSALGSIIWFNTNGTSNPIGALSWTGRIAVGVTVTPTYYCQSANTLSADARQLNALTVVQLYQCN